MLARSLTVMLLNIITFILRFIAAFMSNCGVRVGGRRELDEEDAIDKGDSSRLLSQYRMKADPLFPTVYDRLGEFWRY